MATTDPVVQHVIGENRQLKTDLQKALQVNEDLRAKLTEATRINESSGSASQRQLQAAQALVRRVRKFEENYGSFDTVGKALKHAARIQESVRNFTKRHGSLVKVDEALRSLTLHTKVISESVALADRASEFIAQRGSFESVSEALDRSGPIVEAYAAQGRERLKQVCEAFQVKPAAAKGLIAEDAKIMHKVTRILEAFGEEEAEDEEEVDPSDEEAVEEARVKRRQIRRRILEEMEDEEAAAEKDDAEKTDDEKVEEARRRAGKGAGKGKGKRRINESEDDSEKDDSEKDDSEKDDSEKDDPEKDISEGFVMSRGADRTRSLVTGANFAHTGSKKPASMNESYNHSRDNRNLSRLERLVTTPRAPRG